MIPLIVSGAIAAGSAYMAHRQNKKNVEEQRVQNQKDREWQAYMYRLQREDAFSDYLNQNSYNSPLQQRRRLEEAGLNPALMYKSGDAGGVAAQIRSSQSSPSPQNAPQHDWSGMINAGQQIVPTVAQLAQIKRVGVETNNLQQQTANLQKEELLKEQQIALTASQNARSKFDLKQANELNDLVVQKAKLDLQMSMLTGDKIKAETTNVVQNTAKQEAETANVKQNTQKQKAETSLILTNAETAKLTQTNNVLKAMYDTLQSKLQASKTQAERDQVLSYIELLDKQKEEKDLDIQFKQYVNQLQQMGISPDSPYYAQLITEFWRKILGIKVD